MPMTVPEMLQEAAAIYETRNKLYGNHYKDFGSLMLTWFPRGIELRTENDHTRFALFLLLASKLDRYAQNFVRGGHEDSLLDIAVYSQMLREVDQRIAADG